MPRGDGTGPAGYGPMTGRAMGYCAGYGAPGYMSTGGRGFGGGFGGGFGRGRGWGGGGGFGRGFGWGAAYAAPGYMPQYGPNPNPKDELGMLKEQSEFFQQQLDGIKQRMDELSKEPE